MTAHVRHGHYMLGDRKSGGSRTYRTWAAIWARCTREKHPAFARYGGRGITVCERWSSFENFLADMGERPEGKTIERIDNDRGYEPGNCRWATPMEQQANQRGNVRLMFRGQNLHVAEWARRTGIKDVTLRKRIERGWSAEDVLGKPVAARRSR